MVFSEHELNQIKVQNSHVKRKPERGRKKKKKGPKYYFGNFDVQNPAKGLRKSVDLKNAASD
jgi:hypothetical protein